jgi:hypothetical protein
VVAAGKRAASYRKDAWIKAPIRSIAVKSPVSLGGRPLSRRRTARSHAMASYNCPESLLNGDFVAFNDAAVLRQS